MFGFFNAKKLPERSFRNIFANGIIAFLLIGLFFLTYTSDALSAFSNTDKTAIYNGDTTSNNITLMFNVYWGNEYLDSILETLEENNVKTTFFIGGTWAEKYPELLLKISNDGHEIANHGYYHKDHKTISYERNTEEISNTHDLIKQQLGIDMTLFAPPSGSFSNTTLEIAESLGYKTIMWTRDTIDWRDQDAEIIYQRAIINAYGENLILMHPTENTAEALPRIIEHLKNAGFNLTTVTQNLNIE
ncbi:MAG: polysaccharide deacetylase family protein [Clostridia bacterium]|nr:polysaccharide deacetylase family protein [Clostridia bacterium]